MLNSPEDWPPAGPIDIVQQDLPHASSSLEWWYLNTRLSASDGARYAVFAAFFRRLRRAEHAPHEPTHFHAVTFHCKICSITGYCTAKSFLPCL